jgi:hypothetical protein
MTVTGFIVLLVVMAVFVAQEFTQGFGTPEASTIRDDRWALFYLEVLPVVLVAAASAVSLTGWGAWGMSRAVFFIGVSVLCLGVAIRRFPVSGVCEWPGETAARSLVAAAGAAGRLVSSAPDRTDLEPHFFVLVVRLRRSRTDLND